MQAYVNKTQVLQAGAQQNNQRGQVHQNDERRIASDKVELSSDSRLLHKINGTLHVPEPERAAKTRFLAGVVQKGAYEAPAERIADGMLRDLLKDLG